MNASPAGTRRTFVVQIHGDGQATVENLATRERIPIAISAIGARIEAWLADEGAGPPEREVGSEQHEGDQQ